MPELKTKEFKSPFAMLQWQWRSMIEELAELQRHASDPTCPCVLADSGEYCLQKHALDLHTLAKETIAMAPEHTEMLEQLAEEALDQHNALNERIVCNKPSDAEKDTVIWSRQWRKKIEQLYYRQACKLPAARMKQDEPKTWYHGTSAPEFESFTSDVVYLTDDSKEAESFANNPIAGGGKGRGVPRVLTVTTYPAKVKNIDDKIQEAIEEGDDIDDIISSEAVKARKSGYGYLEFQHPGVSRDLFTARISLYPSRLKIEQYCYKNACKVKAGMKQELSCTLEQVNLLRTYDAFKLNNAPRDHYVDEKGEDKYAYSNDAYSDEYMAKSDDTGRLIRWVYVLTNGKQVSLESYLKMVHPELTHKISSGKNALETIYLKLNTSERQAMINSVPWDEVLPIIEFTSLEDHHKAFNNTERWLRENKHPLANVTNAQNDIAWKIEDILKNRVNMHCSLHQEPKVRITGQCTASSCSLKVKGVVETVETSTPAGLSDAINTVIRHMEKRTGNKVSPLTYAIGPTSLTRYELKYKITPAELLVTSHNPFTFEVNPEYPQILQPRLRGRAANKAQVLTMAAHLEPDALLDDFHSIDRGAPIVNSDNVVLSGNGRVMAIQNAVKEHPASYENYLQHLKAAAENYGLKVTKITNPVLVRELVTKIDLRTFVEEANASTTIAPSAVEVARSDAQKITPTMLNGLEVPEGLSIEDALRSRSNAGFVSSFLDKLSANERGSIADAQGSLSQDGIRRITMAVFVNVFPGDSGLRLSEKFFESTDLNVKNVFNGIVGALGKLAQAEALVKSGARASGLSISEDLAQAVTVYSEIKKTPGMTVEKYLAQSQLFDRQLNKFQEKLLTLIDKRSRSGKKVARLLKAYADIVIESPPPSQSSFMPGEALSKDAALDMADKRSEDVEPATMLQHEVIKKKLSKCNLTEDDLNKALNWRPLREFIATAVGSDKPVELCFVGMVPGSYQITVRDLKPDKLESLSKLASKLVKNIKRVFSASGELVYNVLIPESSPDDLLSWSPQDIKSVRKESAEQAKMFKGSCPTCALMLQQSPVCKLLHKSISEEGAAITVYGERAEQAMQTGDRELERLYSHTAEDETQHKGEFQDAAKTRGCKHEAVKVTDASLHFDPLLTAIGCQINPATCFAQSGKTSELPVCSKDQKKDRESCILKIKETLPAGCNSKTWNKPGKPEGCVNPFKVCTVSIGCRIGKKGE
jgi:hypothetical protein